MFFEFQVIIRIMDESDFAKQLGQRIKNLRKEKKLSQEDLAERIEKSVDTVSNIERGKFFPRLDTAIEIANAFDIELFEIFQTRNLPLNNPEKLRLLNEIFLLLNDQPEDLLRFTLNQTEELVRLKEAFVDKLMK